MRARIWTSGLLKTAESPVLLAKSVMNLMLFDEGVLIVRNGCNVVSNRDRVAGSLTSVRIAGTVTRHSACFRRVDTGGSSLMIAPVSSTRVWTGLVDSIAAPTGPREKSFRHQLGTVAQLQQVISLIEKGPEVWLSLSGR